MFMGPLCLGTGTNVSFTLGACNNNVKGGSFKLQLGSAITPGNTPSVACPSNIVPGLFGYTYPYGFTVPITAKCDPNDPTDVNAKQYGCDIVTTLKGKNYYRYYALETKDAEGTFAFYNSCGGA